MNTLIQNQISADRHDAALELYLANTTDDYAQRIRDCQWAIVAEGTYNMDDAFVLTVERAG